MSIYLDYVVIPTGRKLVGYSTNDLSTRFLKSEIENSNVTAIGLTIVKEVEAIALAEKQLTDSTGKFQDPKVVIHIPKKERRKTLIHKLSEGSKEVEVISIAFSTNVPKVIFAINPIVLCYTCKSR